MTYSFKDAANAMVIKEMECGEGIRVQFTPFSSCLGVVSRKGDLLTGIHLVEVDIQGQFNDEKANAVKDKINGCDEWFFVGFVTDWASGNTKDQVDIIKTVPKQKNSVNLGDGVYGAKWEFNELAYLKAPKYVKL
ncbi:MULTISPECIES: hypothetical protein [Pseudoalteromonas]|jgi:hypothetical protein|uniref:Uncharacterized protein n=1 Tax=Pseudoalteromonas aliena SW19 TaxID=1314866 RepID=A0ABR9E2E2_9GAMM|nr:MULTISPECIES: hypothetical protein [Pseudoalteromonas]MBE0360598.1 hypothetical protein [Pseudoalteromonas aliena SW19]